MGGAIRESTNGVIIDVLVVPGASRSEIVGLHGDRVKIRLASPPTKNQANAALVSLLSKSFGVRRVEITHGRTNRWKTVELHGAALTDVTRALSTEH